MTTVVTTLLTSVWCEELTRKSKFTSPLCDMGGQELQGTPLMTLEEGNEVQCSRACTKNLECMSFNYRKGKGIIYIFTNIVLFLSKCLRNG